jgi:hypothetical protein
MVRDSALVRYVRANLQFPKLFQLPFLSKRATRNITPMSTFEKSTLPKAALEGAMDYVLKALTREYGSTPILLLIDAPRKYLYADTVNTSNVRWLNDLTKEKSAQYGFHFLDLTDEFMKVFRSKCVQLESKYDWHWNQTGHEAAANALYGKLQSLSLFEDWRERHGQVTTSLPFRMAPS